MSTTVERPSETNYTWASRLWGADVIFIDYTSADYKYTQGIDLGLYYIGVLAYSNTSFTITLSMTDLDGAFNDTSTTVLLNGQQQSGFLPSAEATHYYTFFVPAGGKQDVTVTCTPRYGDPDIYANNNGRLPTRHDYQWSATMSGEDRLVIPAAQGCPSTSACQYTILISSFDSSTLYSIVASTMDAATQLEDGISFQASLEQGDIQYFSFYANEWGTTLDITCVGLVGDPDIFVSMKYQRPNETNNEWDSRASGSDGIEIPYAAVGRYFIAVRAWTKTTFVLTAAMGHITLADGRPFTNVVMDYKTQYYLFHVNNPAKTGEIAFSVSATTGDSVMWISTADEAWEYFPPNQPSRTNHHWTSEASGSSIRNLVVLTSDMAGVCYNCTYIVAVESLSYRLTYSITGTDGKNGVMLFPGRPTGTTSITTGQWKYYRTIVDTTEFDVSVDLTSYNGDQEIVLSTFYSHPDFVNRNFNFSKRSGVGSRGAHLYLKKSDIVAGATYYVGVYGWASSTFSLVIATGATMLRPGVASSSATPWNGGGAYFFLTTQGLIASDLIVTVTPLTEASMGSATDKFDVYISSLESMTQPDSTHFQWKSIGMGLGDLLQIKRDDPLYVGNSTYYIGVFGISGVEFSIQVSTQDAVDTLYNNAAVATKGVVPKDTYKYYSIFVETAANFTLTLESCTGNADLYMAQKFFFPKEGESDWRAKNLDAIDQILINDPKITGTTFYIGVLGNGKNNVASSYKLLAKQAAAGTPVAGGDGLIIPATPVGIAGQVTLTWNLATALGHKPNEIIYRVFYAKLESVDKQGVVLYSECGVTESGATEAHGLKQMASDSEILSGKISRTVTGLAAGEIYAFNVMAMTAIKDGYHIFYKLGYATSSKDSSSGGEGVKIAVILGIGIPAALCIAGIIVGLVMKNRKLTKELEVEMHDVPKAAVRKAVRGPQESGGDEKQAGKQSKNYSRLLTEDDPEDYAPPQGDAGDHL
jgi:hypothetical protein